MYVNSCGFFSAVLVLKGIKPLAAIASKAMFIYPVRKFNRPMV